jgi:hypothetical protein
MRVLIVHHGLLPSGNRPTTGGAVRAYNHGKALLAAGHEVHYSHREQDGPGGFSSSLDLVRQAQAIQPDRVISLQLEDAPALSELKVPLAVDLYAPRLIEAPFQGKLREASTLALRAVQSGDVFLVSNPRQGHVWLGILAMAGVDIRSNPTLHIPLVAPQGPRKTLPQEPILIGGGASWPWQDPRKALDPVLEYLDRRGSGRVLWYGGTPLLGDAQESGWSLPEHPRIVQEGWLSYPALLKAYAGATLALDTAPPGSERELALRFRHVDYLGCGLPVLTPPDTPLAQVLGDAGWVGSDLVSLIEEALGDPDELRRRSKAAKQLARSQFGLDQYAPLIRWIESPPKRDPPSSLLLDSAILASRCSTAETRALSLADSLARAQDEVGKKRDEVAELNTQIRSLIDTQQRLAHAVDEVAGFKREAISVLGSRVDLAERSRLELEREVGLLTADNQKKSAELQAMDDLRARLEHDIENLRKEILRLRQRGPFRRG